MREESLVDGIIVPNSSYPSHCVFVVPPNKTGTNYSPVPPMLELVTQFS